MSNYTSEYDRFKAVLAKHKGQLAEFEAVPAKEWGLQSLRWHQDFKALKAQVAGLTEYVEGLKPVIVYPAPAKVDPAVFVGAVEFINIPSPESLNSVSLPVQ